MTNAVVLGSGLIGQAVARRLRQNGQVSVVDRTRRPDAFTMDRAGADVLRSAIAATDATVVVNACGLLRGGATALAQSNADLPEWLVREVLHRSQVRFIHIGSAAEYGDPGGGGRIAETHPANPVGEYAITKAAGALAVTESRSGGLDATVARVFNVFGPGTPTSSPLHQFMTDVSRLPDAGGVVEVQWPETVRDFVHVRDVAEAVARIALADHVPDSINVCSGVGVSFGSIVRAFGARFGKEIDVVSMNCPGVLTVIGDPTRLRELTGLAPEVSADRIAAETESRAETGSRS